LYQLKESVVERDGSFALFVEEISYRVSPAGVRLIGIGEGPAAFAALP
jgi:hypothetical protein